MDASHELGDVRFALHLGEGGDEKGFEGLFDGEWLAGGLGLGAVEHGEAFVIDGGSFAHDDGVEEGFLAFEVVVDGGEVDAGVCDDLADGDGVEALCGEEAFGGALSWCVPFKRLF
jgi:hypothetical protein